MLRLTSVVMVAAALLTGAATAADYSDAANNFRIAVPDGWTQGTAQNELVKFQIVSPRIETTRGNCTVITILMPETRGASQADLDAVGEKTFDEKFFRDGMKSAQYVTEATVVSTGSKSVNGRRAFMVVGDLTADVPGQGVLKARTQQMIELIPGQIFIVTCTASDTGYAQEESDFEIMLNSFAPLSDAPVASLQTPGVSSLTMYTAPDFGGASRVVTQDTANLAVFGWQTPSASVSIAGSGAWEVCDGANFTGRCQMITTTLATGPNGKGFVIVSARHVKAILPPQAGPLEARGAVAAGISAALAR